MSFWLDDYLQLLAGLRAAGRRPLAVAAFLRAPATDAAILRHDVDRRPARAVRMAEREAQAGVAATYYFRCDAAGRFPAGAIGRIAALGHEIGYHYEDFARARGDLTTAQAAFRRHLASLRVLAPCDTVSMHGSPLSRTDNSRLLAAADMTPCGLLGDGTLSLEPHRPVYFTDAGGAWNDPRVNFRDHVGWMPPGLDPLDPAALAACLASHADRPVYFNLHPERWSANALQFGLSLAMDLGARAIKGILRATRR